MDSCKRNNHQRQPKSHTFHAPLERVLMLLPNLAWNWVSKFNYQQLGENAKPQTNEQFQNVAPRIFQPPAISRELPQALMTSYDPLAMVARSLIAAATPASHKSFRQRVRLSLPDLVQSLGFSESRLASFHPPLYASQKRGKPWAKCKN